MTSFNKRQKLVLKKIIDAESVITSTQLSTLVQASVRTIKSDILYINNIIKLRGIIIKAKPRIGYWFELEKDVDIDEIFDFLAKSKQEELNVIPSFNYERIIYIIKKLLVSDDYISIDELMDEIYIGKTTLLLQIKQVKLILSKYRLSIITKHKKGMMIFGSEVDKRLCICEFYFHNDFESNYNLTNNDYKLYNRESYDSIIKIIKEVILEYQINICDYSINNFSMHLLIMISRSKLKHNVNLAINSTETYNSNNYLAAQKIADKIQMIFDIKLLDVEVIYIMNHIDNKEILNNDTLKYEQRSMVTQCLKVIIKEVKYNYSIDLKNDTEFYNSMYLHIPQMVKRIKTNMCMRNTLVYDNLRRYQFATKVSVCAVKIIEYIYQIKVNIMELGYLVLYFNYAIHKIESRKKINIALITSRGRAESLMYYNEISQNFNQNKFHLYNYDYDGFEKNHNVIDYVISTYEINTYDKPKYIISNDNYLESILYNLRKLSLNNLNLDKYVKPEFFYFEIAGDTNNKIMNNINSWFFERGYSNRLNNEFEAIELGNGILHLQDLKDVIDKELCFIGVLKKPVLWDNQVVKIIIFIKTKRDGDKDLSDLCKILSIWCSNLNEIDKFLKNPNYEYFIKSINNWRK